MGVATDGITTARAFKEIEVAGSFAGTGMVLNSYGAARATFPLRMNRAATPQSDQRSAEGVIGYRRPIVLVFLPFAGSYFLGTISHVSNSSERGAP
jgi:hypothetical protein